MYALIIGLFVYRELKLSMLMDCLVSAAKSSSVIMFLAAAAMVSSWLMTVGNRDRNPGSIYSPSNPSYVGYCRNCPAGRHIYGRDTHYYDIDPGSAAGG